MPRKTVAGFTLLELVVVLALVAIAAAVIPPAFVRSEPRAVEASWLDSLSWEAAKGGSPRHTSRRSGGVHIEATADGRGLVLADTTRVDDGDRP